MSEVKKFNLKLEKFLRAVGSCIVLSEDQREYWLREGRKLSPVALDCVLKKIIQMNKIVDTCLRNAMAHDSENKYLYKIQSEVNKIKKEIFHREEVSKETSAEEYLTNNLV